MLTESTIQRIRNSATNYLKSINPKANNLRAAVREIHTTHSFHDMKPFKNHIFNTENIINGADVSNISAEKTCPETTPDDKKLKITNGFVETNYKKRPAPSDTTSTPKIKKSREHLSLLERFPSS